MSEDSLVGTPSPLHTQTSEPYHPTVEISSSSQSPSSNYHRLVEATAIVGLGPTPIAETDPPNTGQDEIEPPVPVLGIPPSTSSDAVPDAVLTCSLDTRDENNNGFQYDTPGSLDVNPGSASSTDSDSNLSLGRPGAGVRHQSLSNRGTMPHPRTPQPESDPEYRTSAGDEREASTPVHRWSFSNGGSGPWRNLAVRRTPRTAPEVFPYPRRLRHRWARGRAGESS